MSGSLLLILHTHLPYVIRHGRWPHGLEWLCEAAAECYIPLLREFFALKQDGIEPGVTVSISPVLLEQLADEEFPGLFVDYLVEREELAAADERTFRSEGREDLVRVARYWIDWYRSVRSDFSDRFGSDIIAGFRDLRDSGAIALQTCGATHGYFPLLGYDQSIHAQVQVGLDSHYRHFRHRPRGIWMPECAYRPAGYWSPPVSTPLPLAGERVGVESHIAAGGINYTVVDAHMIHAGRPVEWYAYPFGAESDRPTLPLEDPRSLYSNYSVATPWANRFPPVSVFPRDVETALHVWSATSGYPGNSPYLEFHKKYHESGGRYWRVTGRGVGLEGKEVYDPALASRQVRIDAEEFARTVNGRMYAYREQTGREGTMTLPFDTELFGHWWHEGPAFLGELLRSLARSDGGVVPRTVASELDRRGPGPRIELPEGSWGDGGGHGVWLNDETAWTWPLLWQAEKRLVDLIVDRDRESRLQERGLRQMARELLLAQASDWQFLITTGSAVDYATERFSDHIAAVGAIGDYVDSLRRGAERYDLFEELCRLEARDRLFPMIDLDHWVWKRAEEALAAPREGE